MMHASGEKQLTSSVPETFEYFLASSQILQLRSESANITNTPANHSTSPFTRLLVHWRASPTTTSTEKAKGTPTHLGQKVKTKRATAAPLGSSTAFGLASPPNGNGSGERSAARRGLIPVVSPSKNAEEE
jgi:hypothetical protein